MNKIKPSRIKFEENELKIDEPLVPQPLVPQRFENISVVDEEEKLEELEDKKEVEVAKKTNKLKFFMVAIVLFFGLLIYDVTTYIIEICEKNLAFGGFFAITGGIFLFLVIKLVSKEVKSLKNLRTINKFYLKSEKLKINPSKESIGFLKELVKFYKKSSIVEIQADLKEIENRLKKDTLLYGEAIELFETKVLSKLDERAYSAINRYIQQSAIATALSPVAILDAVFVIWRNVTMISEVAKIYGFAPSLVFKISLTKQILQSVVFASVAEIMSEYGAYLVGNSLISKISLSISDGIANGILTARIGYNTIDACRPIENKSLKKSKLQNSINRMLKDISKKIF